MLSDVGHSPVYTLAHELTQTGWNGTVAAEAATRRPRLGSAHGDEAQQSNRIHKESIGSTMTTEPTGGAFSGNDRT